MHTTMYLERDEYELLAALGAHVLRKTRHQLEHGGVVMSVDVFHDELEGLVLAEIDFGDDAVAANEFTPPPFCVAEVTTDERFTGGRLARADSRRDARRTAKSSPACASDRACVSTLSCGTTLST